jgi:AcrR family transcriptional regulator
LIEAAKDLFAEHGFDEVSVRDICQAAGANLALVNYYFGGKLGLYLEIIDEAVGLIQQTNEAAFRTPEGTPPLDRLRHFIRVFMVRVLDPERQHSWIHRLMQHEINRPTPAASRIADQAVAPRMRSLAGIITQILGTTPDDVRVIQCVASVHGHCLIFARMLQTPEPFRQALPEWRVLGELGPEEVASHVAEFSIAGILKLREKGRGKREE